MPGQGPTSVLVDLDWPGIAAGPQAEGQVALIVCRLPHEERELPQKV